VAAVKEAKSGREPEPGVCVVVGDADAKARGQTSRLLERVGFEVHEAQTGAEALELARVMQPAAVLLDVALPEISGYQVCHMLRKEFGPELTIFLLSTDRTEPHDKAAGVLLGADDCLAKPVTGAELLARVESHVRPEAPPVNVHARAATLTPSELRVLRRLAEGVHTKAIARELSITPKTVAMHIHNAMKKLDVHTRAHAVALAHQLGLVGGNGYGNVYGKDNGRGTEVEAAHVAAPPRAARPRTLPRHRAPTNSRAGARPTG
jgi:DNA-binding NarL/FixJ family response regulator